MQDLATDAISDLCPEMQQVYKCGNYDFELHMQTVCSSSKQHISSYNNLGYLIVYSAAWICMILEKHSGALHQTMEHWHQ